MIKDDSVKKKESQQPTPQQSGPSIDFNNLQGFYNDFSAIGAFESMPSWEKFSSDFQNPEYRRTFHSFLMKNQKQGIVTDIPEDFREFDSAFVTYPEGEDPYLVGPVIPKEIQKLNMQLADAEQEAVESTEALNDFESVESLKQKNLEDAAKVLTEVDEDQYSVRNDQRLSSLKAEEERLQAEKSADTQLVFSRSGRQLTHLTSKDPVKLDKIEKRIHQIRQAKNNILQRREDRFKDQYDAVTRLGFLWEKGTGQLESAMEGVQLADMAEILEMYNLIDKGQPVNVTRPLPVYIGPGGVGMSYEDPTLKGYKDADPETRVKLKTEMLNKMSERVMDLMDLQKSMAAIPTNPFAEELINSTTAGQAWDIFKKSPIDVIGSLGITSLPFSVAAIGGGVIGGLTAGPAGAAVGVGAGSAAMEYAASITEGMMREVEKIGYSKEQYIEELKALNPDIDPEEFSAAEFFNSEEFQDSILKKKIMEVLASPEAMDRVKTFATKRAVAIGAMDAAGSFIPVKGLSNVILKQAASGTIKKGALAGTTALALTVDATAGGMGEALAQLVTDGELNPGEISAELIGELIGGPAEIATATSTSIFNDLGYDGFVDYVNNARKKVKGQTNENISEAITDEELAGNNDTQEESQSAEPKNDEPAAQENNVPEVEKPLFDALKTINPENSIEYSTEGEGYNQKDTWKILTPEGKVQSVAVLSVRGEKSNIVRIEELAGSGNTLKNIKAIVDDALTREMTVESDNIVLKSLLTGVDRLQSLGYSVNFSPEENLKEETLQNNVLADQYGIEDQKENNVFISTEDGSPVFTITKPPTAERAFSNSRDSVVKKAAQTGTLQEAIGKKVVLGEYEGTLKQDEENNFIIDTGEQIVEVPDTQKNPETTLEQAGLLLSQEPVKAFVATENEDDYNLVTSDPLNLNPETSEAFTYKTSNTNQAGEVVSVTMINESGQERTFRNPELVEQVIWDQYFKRGNKIEAVSSIIDEVETEISEEAPRPEFQLNDSDPVISSILDVLESGGQLSIDQATQARNWINENLQAAVAAKPENLNDIINLLQEFNNDITQNLTEGPQQQQAEQDSAEDEVPESASATEEESANPTLEFLTVPERDVYAQFGLNELFAQADTNSPPVSTRLSNYQQVVEALSWQSEKPVGRDPNPFTNSLFKSIVQKHHRATVAQAIENGETVSDFAVRTYPELNEKLYPVEPTEDIPQELLPREFTRGITRKEFIDQLNNLSDRLPPFQAEAIVDLIDSRAEIWGRINNRPPSDYYKLRLAGIRKDTPITSDQANEIIESYGPDVNSMSDVDLTLQSIISEPEENYKNKLRTKDGDSVSFNSMRQLGLFDKQEPQPSDPILSGLREIDTESGEFAFQEKEFIPQNMFRITQRDYGVYSADDVAFMFHEMENMVNEHMFYVGTDANNKAHVMYVSSGGSNATIVEPSTALRFVQQFDIKRFWMVHNHPSGRMEASSADINLARRIQASLPTSVSMEQSVIIDRDSGVFAYYDIGESENFTIPIPKVEKRNLPVENDLKVEYLGRFKLLKGKERPSTQITSPKQAAEFISENLHAIGKDRTAAVILDNAKRVVAFMVMQNPLTFPGKIESTQTAQDDPFTIELKTYIDRFGGNSVVLASNANYSDFQANQSWLKSIGNSLRDSGLSLDDVLTINSSKNKLETWESLRHDFILREPEEIYRAQEPVSIYDLEGNSTSYSIDELAIIDVFEQDPTADSTKEDIFGQITKQLAPVFYKDLQGDYFEAVRKHLGASGRTLTAEQAQQLGNDFVTYLGSEKQPDNILQEVFAMFKHWLQSIYSTLTGGDAATIPAEVREAFDSLFIDTTEDTRNKIEELESKTIKGRPITVQFKADGSESIPGYFAIVEARDLQASHNIDGSVNQEHFISRAQPRDRKGKKYQIQHQQIAQNLNPSSITGNGSTAFYGAPTTNLRAEAIQGHGRSISIKMSYQEYPKSSSRYVNYLLENADQFGIDQERILEFSEPVLVRMLQVEDKEAIRLGNLKNTDEARMDTKEEALSSVRNMSFEDRRKVGNLIKSSNGTSFRDILDDVGFEILQLIPDITVDDFSSEGAVTVDGKDFLTDLFRSIVFDNESGDSALKAFNDLPHDLIRGIEKSYGVILPMIGTPADLSPILQNAAQIVSQIGKTKGIDTVEDFLRQGDAFTGLNKDRYSETEAQLAKVFMEVQKPSSDLMKSLNTTGAQKALTLLFNQYEDQIYGKTDLFNTIPARGNTDEGASQSFGETFNPGQSQQRQSQQPASKPGTTADGSSDQEQVDSEASQILNAVDLPELVKNKNRQPKTSKKTVSREDIVNTVIEKLNIAVATGKSNNLRHNLGFYREGNASRIIRQRAANDIWTLAHEVGHGLHDILFQKKVHPEYDSELIPLGEKTSRKTYSPNQVRKEGQAEFFRHLILVPEQAKEKAPTYFEAFNDRLEQYPEIKEAVDELYSLYDQYLSQDLVTQLESQIAYDDQTPSRRARQEETTLQYLYRKIFNNLIPLDRMRVNLEGEGASVDPELVTRDSFKLAQLNRGIDGMIQGWVQFGVRDKNGKITAKGIEDIFKDNNIDSVEKKKNFDTYLIAERGLELYEQQEKGQRKLKSIPDTRGGALGFTKEQAQAAVDKYGTPEFQQAAKELYAWNDATLEWLVDREYMSRDQIEQVKSMNRRYVPMHRIMDFMEDKGSSSGAASLVNQPSLFQKIRGSGRRIKPAVETMILNTKKMVDAAERNYAAIQAFELIKKSEGGGQYADQVMQPRKPIKGELNQIKSTLKAAGLDKEILDLIDMEQVFTLWTPSRLNPKQGEVFIRRGGETFVWQVHNEALYDALTMHDSHTSNFISRILTLSRSLFRHGVVMSLNFITGNTSRDQFTAHVNSRYGYAFVHLNPLKKDFGSSDFIKGMMSILKQDENYQLWLQSKAGISGIIDQNRKTISRTIKQLGEPKTERFIKGVLFPARWLQTVEAFSSVFENTTRVGEFIKGLEIEGSGEEALGRAAISSREISGDFARGGEWSKFIGKYKAFFNAGLQGDLVLAQAIKRDPVSFFIRGAITMTIPTLALNYLLSGNPDWEERKEEREMYWLIPLGDPQTTTKWARIRKPWTLGSFFGTLLPEAIESGANQEMPEGMDELFDGVDPARIVMDLMPNALLPLIEVSAGDQGYSYFWQKSIDPYFDTELEPYLRYGAQNTELEKMMGKFLNYSPRKIRHLIRGYTGTLGIETEELVSEYIIEQLNGLNRPPAPDSNLGEKPGLKPFFSPELTANSSGSVQEFYKLLEQARTASRTYKAIQDPEEKQQYFNEHEQMIRNASKYNSLSERFTEIREEIASIYESYVIDSSKKNEMLKDKNQEIINLAQKAVELWSLTPKPRD